MKLYEKGSYCLNSTDNFTSTHISYINFQNWINVMENFTNNNANYLTPDGIVGSETWGWLVTYYGG